MPRVLIVDDNPAMLARVTAALSVNCTVLAAVADGPAALQADATFHPDVIVLDVSMPGMTGFEVAERLRLAGSTAAIVFLTVHGDDEFVAAARAAGAIGYVVKPRLASDLLHAIREARAGRAFVSARR